MHHNWAVITGQYNHPTIIHGICKGFCIVPNYPRRMDGGCLSCWAPSSRQQKISLCNFLHGWPLILRWSISLILSREGGGWFGYSAYISVQNYQRLYNPFDVNVTGWRGHSDSNISYTWSSLQRKLVAREEKRKHRKSKLTQPFQPLLSKMPTCSSFKFPPISNKCCAIATAGKTRWNTMKSITQGMTLLH